jgi:L-ascorbate metabolism protein UlaG (beta-lactamase superfamily)
MNPEDAVRAHKILNASKSMGIHFATFNEHPEQAFDAHEKDLKTALRKYDVSEDDFRILKFGEGTELHN